MSNHVVIDLCSSDEEGPPKVKKEAGVIPSKPEPPKVNKQTDAIHKGGRRIFVNIKEFATQLCEVSEGIDQLLKSGQSEDSVKAKTVELLPYIVIPSRDAHELGDMIAPDSKWAKEEAEMEYLRNVKCHDKNGAWPAFPVGKSGLHIVVLLLDPGKGANDIIKEVKKDHVARYMAFETAFVHNPNLYADDSDATYSSSDEDEKTKKKKRNATKWTSFKVEPKKKPNSNGGRSSSNSSTGGGGAKKQAATGVAKSEVKFCKKRKGANGKPLPRAGTFNSSWDGVGSNSKEEMLQRSKNAENAISELALPSNTAEDSDDDWAVTKGEAHVIKRQKLV